MVKDEVYWEFDRLLYKSHGMKHAMRVRELGIVTLTHPRKFGELKTWVEPRTRISIFHPKKKDADSVTVMTPALHAHWRGENRCDLRFKAFQQRIYLHRLCAFAYQNKQKLTWEQFNKRKDKNTFEYEADPPQVLYPTPLARSSQQGSFFCLNMSVKMDGIGAGNRPQKGPGTPELQKTPK